MKYTESISTHRNDARFFKKTTKLPPVSCKIYETPKELLKRLVVPYKYYKIFDYSAELVMVSRRKNRTFISATQLKVVPSTYHVMG